MYPLTGKIFPSISPVACQVTKLLKMIGSRVKKGVAPQRQLDLFRSLTPIVEHAVSFDLTELARRQKLDLDIQYSKRMRFGWRVSWKNAGRKAILTAPEIVQLAPPNIKTYLINWVALMHKPKRRWTKSDKMQKKMWEARTQEFLENPDPALFAEHPKKQSILRRNKHWKLKRLSRFNPIGTYHNLSNIFDKINQTYFAGQLQAQITWSNRIGGLSTHHQEQDDKGNAIHIITISRGYDSPDASPDIVGGVVYHECLHIAIPAYYKNGKRIVHGPEFKQREKQYRYFEEWRAWHKWQLPKSLILLKRQKYSI